MRGKPRYQDRHKAQWCHVYTIKVSRVDTAVLRFSQARGGQDGSAARHGFPLISATRLATACLAARGSAAIVVLLHVSDAPVYHARDQLGGVLALHLEHGVLAHGSEDAHWVVAIDAGIPKRDHPEVSSQSLCPHPLRGVQPVKAVPQSLRLCVPERRVVLRARSRKDEELE